MDDPIVIYEDKNFLAVNKPSGMQVHAARIHADETRMNADKISREQATLVDWLIERYPEIKTVGDDPETRPGIVHRLDKDTSGMMLAVKNQQTFEYLKSLFQKHEIKKTYLALVYGKLEPKTGVITKPIGIKNGTTKRSVHSAKMAKTAVTEYRVLKQFELPRESASSLRQSALTLLEVRPKTGRTHQIRVHLASIGHPVVGDNLYGSKKLHTTYYLLPTRLMLHALSLEFTTEEGKRMKIEAEVPEEFTEILAKIR